MAQELERREQAAAASARAAAGRLRARAAAPQLDPVLVTELADALRSQLERGLPDEPEPAVELTPQAPPAPTPTPAEVSRSNT